MATHRVLLSVVLCTLVLFRGDSVASGQTGVQSNWELLHAKEKRFVEYSRNFFGFVKLGGGSSYEAALAMDFSTIALESSDHLAAARTLWEIYGDLSCEEDRGRIRPLVKREFLFYSKQIDTAIKETNVGIVQTKMSGIAAEGTRMRDDLREAKNILDSIKIQ